MSGIKITRIAITMVIISFVMSTVISLWSLQLVTEKNTQELSKLLASRIHDHITTELAESITLSRSMARDSFMINAMKKEKSDCLEDIEQIMSNYLLAQKNDYGVEAAFAVVDSSLCYYSFNGFNRKVSPRTNERDKWYYDIVSSGKQYTLEVDRYELDQDKWTVFVNARVVDENGNLLGICGVGSKMTGEQDFFASLEKNYGVKISLVDPNGKIQVSTDESRIDKKLRQDIKLNKDNDYNYQKIDGNNFAVVKYIDRLGWHLIVESDQNTVRGSLWNVLLLNIVMCVVVMVIMLLSIRIIIFRHRALNIASMVDQPTQLLNRRAFEEKKSALAKVSLDENFVYVTADLNGLKVANDTLGHEAGDELIRGAADCLKATFGAFGDVYRIGGDEFAAILEMSEEQYHKSSESLQETMANWKGKLQSGLSISCGHAFSREFPSENITELAKISDERMYKAKAEYYRKTGKQRRIS